MRAEPHFDDAVHAQALVNTAGDGFNFGQLGHRFILEHGLFDITQFATGL
jgi:hypothetical protein